MQGNRRRPCPERRISLQPTEEYVPSTEFRESTPKCGTTRNTPDLRNLLHWKSVKLCCNDDNDKDSNNATTQSIEGITWPKPTTKQTNTKYVQTRKKLNAPTHILSPVKTPPDIQQSTFERQTPVLQALVVRDPRRPRSFPFLPIPKETSAIKPPHIEPHPSMYNRTVVYIVTRHKPF